MKTLLSLSAAALALGLATAASAEERIPATALPPTHIVHKLVGDGVDLRGLEYERGAYEARVRTTDGKLIKMAVDPLSGDFTDSRSRVRDDAGPAPRLSASDAVMAVAATGHWDVSEIEYRGGAWMVRASDDKGASARFAVDDTSGQLASR
ncbi:MAG: PepSY domain-containing protein [Solirubrobacterales bacterium]